nr:helix-turn-helix transcriptional regulator [Methyloceanibacter caenitepidi]
MTPRQHGLVKSVHSDAQKAFGQLLLEARKRAGLTQWEVAERLKKPQSFVAKYEGGERRIDVLEFLVIARVLDADPVRLLRTLMKRLG